MNNNVEKSNISVGKDGLQREMTVSSLDIEMLKSKSANNLTVADKAIIMQKAINVMAVIKSLQDNVQDVFDKLGYNVNKAFHRVNLQELYSKRIQENKDFYTAQNLVNEIHSLLDEAIERKNSICEYCNGSGDSLSGNNPNSSSCSYCGGTGEL